MNPDDPVCLCFHVTRRKVVRFIRVEKPRRASQLSECFGAGTGCGWCRPYLQRLMLEYSNQPPQPSHGDPPHSDMSLSEAESLPEWDTLTPEEYQQARARFREKSKMAKQPEQGKTDSSRQE